MLPSIFRAKERSVLKVEAACRFETLAHVISDRNAILLLLFLLGD